MAALIPCFMVATQAEELAEYSCSVFPNSGISRISRHPEGSDQAGQVLTVEFQLSGKPFTALNGMDAGFSMGLTFYITCQDQAEVDHYWEAFLDGGEEGQCGWIKDRFGVWWQVAPARMAEFFSSEDRAAAGRAMAAMMTMRKIDLAIIEAAFADEEQ
ncbi:VOC family protein [Acaricomes phytoseiuli]|uniref:VOC family protein n=1 Tax=Acaricomes phytoseiuli TaxID=291968 RepID=UPI0003A08DC1|nr:VOC family protein [Acaricomes phytoseiuli]MCW1249344.1 VOC family protein [Acaricomes phytoseiuli]